MGRPPASPLTGRFDTTATRLPLVYLASPLRAKNAFEFDQAWEESDRIDPALAHSDGAVEATAYLARRFVKEARKNPRRWAESTPTCMLSHEQAPLYTATGSDGQWEACYVQ